MMPGFFSRPLRVQVSAADGCGMNPLIRTEDGIGVIGWPQSVSSGGAEIQGAGLGFVPSFGSVPASRRCRLLRWRHTTTVVVSTARAR